MNLAHPPPNMIPLFPDTELTESLIVPHTWSDLSSAEKRCHAGAANSVGMPCLSPNWVMEDMEKTRRSLSKGQLLIVSVLGQKHTSNGVSRDVVQDFIYTARFAQDAGAHAIELNFSCPNVGYPQAFYKDPDTLEGLLQPIMVALKSIPVTVKIGLCQGEHPREITRTLARVGVRGLSCINGIPCALRTHAGRPAFGTLERLTAGVSGTPLHPLAVRFGQEAYSFNRQERLDMTILAIITRA